MCIFSQPVISVNNTKIFARLSGNQTQFFVYEMNYESHAENAMILPVPVRQPSREDRLRFIDLQEYEHFFDDLDKGFPNMDNTLSIGCSAAFNDTAVGLAVFEVGNYIASFVPTLSDFNRLDARFNLPEETWARVPQYKDYGFAVFQLAFGSYKPHPMAFEFETVNDSIYFPTLHIHDGEVHETEEFDHGLYMQHAGLDSQVWGYENNDVPDRSTGMVRSQDVAKTFCDIERAQGIVDGNLLVHRRIIRGNQPNRDTEILTIGDAKKPSFNLKPLWTSARPYLPWVLVAGAFAWFFRRRIQIRRAAAGAELDTNEQTGVDSH